MVRALSATLEAAQQETMRTPYVSIVFSDTTDYSSRLLRLEFTETPYGADLADKNAGIILLDDYDRGVADMRGKSIDIVIGLTTSAGDEGVTYPRMWVKSQTWHSSPSGLFSTIYLMDMWEYLSIHEYEGEGTPPYFKTIFERTLTPYELMEDMLADNGITLSLSGDADAIVNTFTPYLEINNQPYEEYRSIIYRLIMMTMSYLRMTENMTAEITYPQEGDAPNRSYYSYQMFYFYRFTDTLNELIPNHIYVYCNDTDVDMENPTVWPNLVTGEASSAEAIARFTEINRHYRVASILNQTDANARAAAILTRWQAELQPAFMVIPHDCALELYDKVGVYDARG